MLFQDIYRGRRVFLTGHTGFKGAWLAMWLKELGAEVMGYALPPPDEENLYLVCGLEGRFSSVTGDIRNLDEMKAALDRFRPEIVFHLAAQSLVRRSYDEPVLTYDTNVMGTVNLLEASRLCPSVRAIVIITSDKCYENKEWIWGYQEDDPMGGYDPYSSSKGCAELVTVAYRNSYFNPDAYQSHGVSLSSVRAGNVIGGGDWADDRLVPDCVRALVKGEPVRVRNPHAVRPWQHVLEPLRGYLTLGARMLEEGGRFSGGWNFGPSDESTVTVGKIVGKVVELWGSGSWEDLSQSGKQGPHEATFLKLNICKVRQVLNWRPIISLDEALLMTVEWYKQYHQRPGTIPEFSLEQIRHYTELVERGA